MRLFSWTTDAIPDYTPGMIVAMGVDAEQARTFARAVFDAHITRLSPHAAAQARATLERDLSVQPTITVTGAVLLEGGN